MTKAPHSDPEFIALSQVFDALSPLDKEAQERVLAYISRKLGIGSATLDRREIAQRGSVVEDLGSSGEANSQEVENSDDSDGVNAVAIKWIKRSGLDAKKLGQLFSIGGTEIDLIAKKVPGDNKKARLRSVVLLKGIAAYLGTGAARVSSQQIKEAAVHYDAFDDKNHAAYLKSFSAEVGGTKESGYTLNARGITAATELISAIVNPK